MYRHLKSATVRLRRASKTGARSARLFAAALAADDPLHSGTRWDVQKSNRKHCVRSKCQSLYAFFSSGHLLTCSYNYWFIVNEIYFLKLLYWVLVGISRVSFLAASSQRFLVASRSSWPSKVSALSIQLAHHLTANPVDLEHVVEETLWTEWKQKTFSPAYRRRSDGPCWISSSDCRASPISDAHCRRAWALPGLPLPPKRQSRSWKHRLPKGLEKK